VIITIAFQHMNVADAVKAGLGLEQEWHGLEGPALLATVREVRPPS
jgi:hypothetical protein